MSAEKSRKSFFSRLKSFLITTFVGGFAVVLPVALLIAVVQFLWRFLTGVLSPMRGLINFPPDVESWIVDLSSVLIIVIAFFLIGLIVKTGLGKRVHSVIDKRVLSQIPFYGTLRDTVQQFFGKKKMPFSQVVIADVMNTKMTGFVTDERDDGTYTIFVPTAPNPTNGFIFHVKKKQLEFLDLRPDEAMRTIFGMGTGSSLLFKSTKSKE